MATGQMIISLVLAFMFPTWERISVEDWKFYAGSEFGLYQYDASDVRILPSNIVRVRQKLVLSDRGRANLVQAIGSEYGKTREIIAIREIDCKAQKTRILGLIYISDEGEIINRESFESITWDDVPPDSVDDVLHHAVCKQPELQTGGQKQVRKVLQ